MAKARVYGKNQTYIPNSKADMRFRKKIYQRGKDFADRDEERHKERFERRQVKELECMKYGNA